MNLNNFFISNTQLINSDKDNLRFSKKIGNTTISADFNFKINKIGDVSFIFLGNLNGYFKEKKFYKHNDIKIIFKKLNLTKKITKEKIDLIDGNFLIIEIKKNNNLKICIDKYAKNDLFYFSNQNNFSISNNFKLLIKYLDKKTINQSATALMMSTLGTRPAKKDTIISEIKRLGLNQNILIEKKLSLIEENYLCKKSEYYDDKKIEEYFEIYKDYVSNIDKNQSKTIFMSSGYDSSFIAASTRNFNSKSKIDGITCKLQYSNRSGVYNKYEIIKIKKLSERYNINAHFVDMNLINNFQKYSEHISEICSQRMITNSLGAMMHSILSKKASDLNSENIIAGEISDGAHNFGFSQFFTYTDHESNGFREYADKKICYLYSPSFLKKIKNNTFQNDFVFTEMCHKKNINIRKLKNLSNKEIINEVLGSLFLTSSRLPLEDEKNSPVLKSYEHEYRKYYINNYFNTLKLDSFNSIYSAYLHLYNSFHWQGSTVSTLGHFAEANNKKMVLPFWNPLIQDYLEKMPEDWGRNLETNNIKYPLKQAFKRYLDFPEFIEKGHHSYVYDENRYVDPLKEILIEKKTAKYIKGILQKRHPLDYFSKKSFNHNYIYKAINNFKKNKLENPSHIWKLFNFSKLILDSGL
jgi:hypothetical protein